MKRKKRVGERNEGMTMTRRRGREKKMNEKKKMQETKMGGTPMRQLPAFF